MKKYMLKNQKGFTLIEIIAVLVILGILAAIAIPKYLDMRKDAVLKAAAGAQTELNARERLKLAEWKLKDGPGVYPGPTDASTTLPAGSVAPVDTKLGSDWNSNNAISNNDAFSFQGKTVKFTRKTPDDASNEPFYWIVTVTD